MARTFGSTNKNKDRLFKALRKEYGEDFDPILVMAKNSHEMQLTLDAFMTQDDDTEIVDCEGEVTTARLLAMKMIPEVNKEWSRIAEYVTPKLKAVEVEITGEMISVTEQRGVSEIILRVEELTVGRAEGDTESFVSD